MILKNKTKILEQKDNSNYLRTIDIATVKGVLLFLHFKSGSTLFLIKISMISKRLKKQAVHIGEKVPFTSVFGFAPKLKSFSTKYLLLMEIASLKGPPKILTWRLFSSTL